MARQGLCRFTTRPRQVRRRHPIELELNRESVSPAAMRAIALAGVVIFFGLMSLGLPLAVLPRHVDLTLGFGPVVAGLTLAAEALVTLITRPWVGRFTDQRGARFATMIGLMAAATSGLFYLLAGSWTTSRESALALILAGRAAMGVGQSFLFTGGTAWAVGLAGFERAGKAISWIGIAMFSGIAAGTALGGISGALVDSLRGSMEVDASASGFLFSNGFELAATITLIAPLIGLAVAFAVPPAPIVAATHGASGLRALVTAIWRPSLAFGLASAGYAALTSFVVLAFTAKGWTGGETALSAYVVAFVLSRGVFGQTSDSTHGPGPITVALAVEAAGLILLWNADNHWVGITGAVISGAGMSMIYPLLALPAIRAVPRSQTASALGLYDASYDLASLLTPPLCGVIAATVGHQAIFLVAGLTVLVGILPARVAWLRVRPVSDVASAMRERAHSSPRRVNC